MGLVHLYYGYGKGKTTAAVGLAVRCAGSGGRVLFFQFLKDNSSSERKILDNIWGIDIISGKDSEKFVFNMSDEEKREASKYYKNKLNYIMSRSEAYDMLVLDELGDTISSGLIDENELIDLINENRKNTETVITGHDVSPKLISCCDYVTEMKKIKHPYDNGAAARKGIEF